MRNFVTIQSEAKPRCAASPLIIQRGWLRMGGMALLRFAVIMLVLAPNLAPAQAQSPPAPPVPSIPAPAAPSVPPSPPSAAPDTAKSGADMAARDIAARPALRLRAQSTWEQGFSTVRKSIDLLGAEAARLGLLKDGNPLAHFVDSDDIGFTFEAFVPLVMAAPSGVPLMHGIEAGSTPAGRGLSFPHEGAYDELDAAYEAITALLDDKGFVATGQFFEEYIFLPEKSDDPALRMNIFVFLR